MKLTGDQFRRLWEAVLDAFDRNSLTRTLRFELNRDLFDYGSPAHNDKDLFFNLIGVANADGWIDKLLSALKVGNPGNPLLQAVLSDILSSRQQTAQAIEAAGIDPHTACVIGRRILINRSDLRDHMRRFTQPTAFDPHLLIVTGPNSSGKTYTREFLKFLSSYFNLTDPVYIKLSNWPGGNCSPDDLMDSIRSKMGLPTDHLPVNDIAQGPRRAIKLKDWFIGKARDLNAEQWIILDDLDQPGVPTETLDLVDLLAKEVTENIVPNLRLVLLGFERSFPPDIARDILFERLEPMDDVTVQLYAPEAVAQYLDDEQQIADQANLVATEALRDINPPFDRDKMIRLTRQFEDAVANFLDRI